jgi:hypothetical protein
MSTAPPEWVVEATRGFVEMNGEAAEVATYYRTSQAGVWDAINVGADPSEALPDMEWLRHEDTHVVVVTGDFTIHRAPRPPGSGSPRGSTAVLFWSARGHGVALRRVVDRSSLGDGTDFFWRER